MQSNDINNVLKFPDSNFKADCLAARNSGVEGRLVRRQSIFDQLGFKEGARYYDVYNENDCWIGEYTIIPKQAIISDEDQKKVDEYLMNKRNTDSVPLFQA